MDDLIPTLGELAYARVRVNELEIQRISDSLSAQIPEIELEVKFEHGH
jgi:hypothetical protein